MKEIIKKAGILIEALPYIQSFKGKVTVIKFGGSAMSDEHWIKNVLKDIVFLYTVGIKPVVVHGGGSKISAALKRLGRKTKFVQGFRVTDEQTIQTVEEVLFDKVNKDIVDMIRSIGANAEGLSGKKHDIIIAQKHTLDPPYDKHDLGFVGDVERINTHAITSVIKENKIPVIAPLGIGKDGKTYNINADLAAGEIAKAIGSEKLVFLTDVIGILKDQNNENSLVSHLDIGLVKSLIKKGIISGGMIPKVTAGMRAVNSGVNKTHIINGKLPHTLLLEIFTDKGIGTEIVKKS